MTEAQYRYKIAIIILSANISVFILIIALYAFGAFLPKETVAILQLLVPIKSTYMTALVKYVIENKYEITREKNISFQLSKLYISTTVIIISCHIIFLIISIIMFACNQVITDLHAMKASIVVIETLFGAYIGIIISDMFKVEKK